MKRTWQPKVKKRKRKHGFRARMKVNSNIISGRRRKGRWILSV